MTHRAASPSQKDLDQQLIRLRTAALSGHLTTASSLIGNGVDPTFYGDQILLDIYAAKLNDDLDMLRLFCGLGKVRIDLGVSGDINKRLLRDEWYEALPKIARGVWSEYFYFFMHQIFDPSLWRNHRVEEVAAEAQRITDAVIHFASTDTDPLSDYYRQAFPNFIQVQAHKVMHHLRCARQRPLPVAASPAPPVHL